MTPWLPGRGHSWEICGALCGFSTNCPTPVPRVAKREAVQAGFPGEETEAPSSDPQVGLGQPVPYHSTVPGASRCVCVGVGLGRTGRSRRAHGPWGPCGSPLKGHLIIFEAPDGCLPDLSGPHLLSLAWELQWFTDGPEASGLRLGCPSGCLPSPSQARACGVADRRHTAMETSAVWPIPALPSEQGGGVRSLFWVRTLAPLREGAFRRWLKVVTAPVIVVRWAWCPHLTPGDTEAQDAQRGTVWGQVPCCAI